jgi:uncharacterized membrane-anchored protein
MRPYDHPLRTVLHEEVHARPPVALWPRDRILNQAFLLKGSDRQQQLDWINAINKQTKQSIDPNHGQTFRIIELRPAPQRIIIKWELHGEFSSISAIVQQKDLIAEAPIKTRPAIENEVNDLLSKLSIKPMHEAGGLRISAIDIAFEDRDLFLAADGVAHLFSGNTLIGSTILTNKKAQLWTDLQINQDGYISYFIPHAGMGSRQAGRVARRITEVEIYRMASMLAFPVAKSLSAPLRNAEAELSELSKQISMAQNQESVATHQDGEFLEIISTLGL